MVIPKTKKKKAPDFIGKKKILKGIWKKREIEYVENEVIIKFDSGEGSAASILRKLKKKELKDSKLSKPIDEFGVGKLLVKGDILKVCEKVQQEKGVAFVEPNIVDRPMITTPNDTHYAANQWPLPLIGMPDAWDIETGDPNVMIAIVDSGIPMTGSPLTLSHPDLNDTSRIILGSDLVNSTSTPFDEFGHGTHVAGTASAESDNATGVAGVSWDTKLYIIKVFDANGSGSSQLFHDAVIEAVDYADTNGLRLVINYSGGGGQSYLKEQAVIYARNHNALIVAAAGNDYHGNVIWPAAYSSTYDNVIAVSSTDSGDNLSGFSNIGAEINVAAPGEGVYSCMPNYVVNMNTWWGYSQNYDHMDGTSMASPHVAGLAALLLSYDNTLDPDEVRDILEDNAVDLGPAGWDQSYGFGRIDAHASVDSLVPISPLCNTKFDFTYCLYVKEVCPSKEIIWCPVKTDVLSCHYKAEACLIKHELQPCNYRLDVPCYKYEATCPPFDLGCLREDFFDCTRENMTIDPEWKEIFVRRGDPSAEPIIRKNPMKHIKSMTRIKNPRRKRFNQ